MNLMNFFNLSYWFSQPDPALGFTKWFLVLSFLGLVLVGLVLRILLVKQKDKIIKDIYRRLSNIGFTIGVFGLLWMFFRQESVVFLAWRFWIIVIGFSFALLLIKVLNYIFKRVPKIKEENQKRLERQRYLPGR